ncbi:MAG: GIY-YIG nuclease family protein [Candidatus Zixiibacteriota bacterium]
MFYVYVLRSSVDGNLYIGQTSDLEKRVALHNEGRIRSTSRRCPLELVHVEEYETRGEAIKRERFLKSIKGRDFKRALRESKQGL